MAPSVIPTLLSVPPFSNLSVYSIEGDAGHRGHDHDCNERGTTAPNAFRGEKKAQRLAKEWIFSPWLVTVIQSSEWTYKGKETKQLWLYYDLNDWEYPQTHHGKQLKQCVIMWHENKALNGALNVSRNQLMGITTSLLKNQLRFLKNLPAVLFTVGPVPTLRKAAAHSQSPPCLLHSRAVWPTPIRLPGTC